MPYKEGDKFETNISELGEIYDDIMFNYNKPYQKTENFPSTAKGFTIGRGKKLYWFLIFQYKNGWCRCYPSDSGYYQTVYDNSKKITVHF